MNPYEINNLVSQYGLLLATLFFYSKLVANDNSRERRQVEAEVKNWCKAVFRIGSNSSGELQRAGEKVRQRFPKDMDLILQSYDELSVEEPNLKLPPLYKFLTSMDGVEKDKWPSSGEAMAGRLKIYRR